VEEWASIVTFHGLVPKGTAPPAFRDIGADADMAFGACPGCDEPYRRRLAPPQDEKRNHHDDGRDPGNRMVVPNMMSFPSQNNPERDVEEEEAQHSANRSLPNGMSGVSHFGAL
jgi:hypothetical protein